MAKKLSRAPAALTAVAAFMTILMIGAAPALAHHDPNHPNGGGNASATAPSADTARQDDVTTGSETTDSDGDADSDSTTAFTEDTDTNDGTVNNVVDDGDNQHPSGKDRSVEKGRSGNQGKSESNPDDSKGPKRFEGQPGPDKPNGPGGTDLADQDGNNGCGNDDDFDDDNNGNCGKPEADENEDENEVVVEDENEIIVENENEVIVDDKIVDEDEVLTDDDSVDDDQIVDEVTDEDEVITDEDEVIVDDERLVAPESDEKPSAPIEDLVLGSVTSRAAEAPAVTAAPDARPAAAPQGQVLPVTGGSLALLLTMGIALVAAGLTALSVRSMPSLSRKK